ncbi:hypothetical protein JOQ06_015013, partial [Pogonophryne albipinna]
MMADRSVDLSALPKEVRDQLAELDLELSEVWPAYVQSGEYVQASSITVLCTK